MSSAPFEDAFGDLNLALDAAGDSIAVLPLTSVVEDPSNPRSSFDEAELRSLADTLRDRGLLQPIVVRPAGADGRHMIRFGARRFRAAKLAGLTDIRAIVQADEGEERDVLIQQLIENEQREDLSTADLAKAVERLLAMKLSQSEIARRLGRPREQVVMLASVRDMPAELKALAPRLGVRTLYELHTAWKADAARTRAWLSGRDPRSITQSAARELAGRPAPTRQVVRDPSDGSVRDTESTQGPAPAKSPQAGRRRSGGVSALEDAKPPPGMPIFEVKARGVQGQLVLENVRAPSAGVMVRLADGSLKPVAASDIRIVRVRPG